MTYLKPQKQVELPKLCPKFHLEIFKRILDCVIFFLHLIFRIAL